MLRSTLPMLAVAALAATAGAQEPPRPPARPVPAPTPAPAPTPRASLFDQLEHEMRMREWSLQDRMHELTPRLEELQHSLELRQWELYDRMAPHMDELQWGLQDRLHEMAPRLEELQWQLEHELTPLADLAPLHDLELRHELAPRMFDDLQWQLDTERFREHELFEALQHWGPEPRLDLPASKYPQDPADTLYRQAREMINRGEYRRAAETFRSIGQRFASSKYAPEALYWEAFALYRIGTVADMRAALTALDTQKEKFPQAHNREAASLALRIRGELAANGDAEAREELRRTPGAMQGQTTPPGLSTRAPRAPTPSAPPGQRTQAGQASQTAQGANCDREDLAVRLEALSALSKIESPEVTPALRRVLQRRDECSATLRRRAVLLLAQQQGAEVGATLIDVARNDPDMNVRREAVGMLGRVPTEQAVTALQQILQSDEPRLATAAMRALRSNESPGAAQAVRSVIERNDVSESVRLAALSSFDRATPEDAAYLRSVYPKLESRRLRSQAIQTIARIGGPENQQWLLTLARNEGESIELRSEALGRAAATAPIADVARLYDGVSDRRLKERVILTLSSRKEDEAVDKLIAIARSDADPELRRVAIARLSQKKDPRTTQLLLEIINR